MISKETRVPRAQWKVCHIDHGCNNDAFSCEICSKTRQKNKHQRKKRSRHAKLIDGALYPKKDSCIIPIPREGRPYVDHNTISERYKVENPEIAPKL